MLTRRTAPKRARGQQLKGEVFLPAKHESSAPIKRNQLYGLVMMVFDIYKEDFIFFFIVLYDNNDWE